MRRYRTQRDIKPSLVTHFPSLSKGLNRDPDIHMFTEDIHLAIMPIGGEQINGKSSLLNFKGKHQIVKEQKKLLVN